MAADGEPSFTTVLLVRHAAHDGGEGVLCGRMPGVRLSLSGRSQATRLARAIAPLQPEAIYTSPMERCEETAAAIGAACARPVEADLRLQEIDYGTWTGKRFDQLDRDPLWRLWNEQRATASPPGGESMSAVQERASAALDSWRERHLGECVVAVTHMDVVRALVCEVLGLTLDRVHAFDIDLASVSTLLLWPGGGGKLTGLNRTEVPISAYGAREAAA